MKVKILQNISGPWGSGQQFIKGRVYRADVATNQPRAFRLVNKKQDIKVTKVFVYQNKEDRHPLLIENIKGDDQTFKIVDFPDYQQFVEEYKQSKIKIPRVHKIVKDGYKLRDGFQPLTEEISIKYPKLFRCTMGTTKGTCNKESKYFKVIGSGRAAIRIGRCHNCSTFRVK